jgi:hypothetical protein
VPNNLIVDNVSPTLTRWYIDRSLYLSTRTLTLYMHFDEPVAVRNVTQFVIYNSSHLLLDTTESFRVHASSVSFIIFRFGHFLILL